MTTKVQLESFSCSFSLCQGVRAFNLISDLRLRRAVFEKESLGLPPSDGLMRPYLSLITILPTQGRSSRYAVLCVQCVCMQRRKRGLTNCAGAGKQQAGALKRGLGKVELGRRPLSEKP